MKRLFAFVLLMIFFVFAAPAVCAQSEQTAESITANIEKKLEGSTSDEVRKALDSTGISVSSPKAVSNIEPKGLLEKAWNHFKESLRSPFVMLAKLIAFIGHVNIHSRLPCIIHLV